MIFNPYLRIAVLFTISVTKKGYIIFTNMRSTPSYTTRFRNFQRAIKQYDLNLKKGSIAYIMTNEGEDQIYYQGNFNLNQNNFTPLTRRQEVQQALFISERIRQRKQRELEQLSNEQQEDSVQIELVHTY